MTSDHRKLRQLRHAVHEALLSVNNALGTVPTTQRRASLEFARNTLEMALDETKPEPDPGNLADGEELRPGRSER